MRISRDDSLRGWTVCVLTLAALACGDDAGKKDGGDEPEGEPCASPGYRETGCACSEEQPPGMRFCKEDKIWSPCTCPPPRQGACVEGERLQCSRTCPGESEPRIVLCLQGGTFDCSCEGEAPQLDAGDRPRRDGGRR